MEKILKRYICLIVLSLSLTHESLTSHILLKWSRTITRTKWILLCVMDDCEEQIAELCLFWSAHEMAKCWEKNGIKFTISNSSLSFFYLLLSNVQIIKERKINSFVSLRKEQTIEWSERWESMSISLLAPFKNISLY